MIHNGTLDRIHVLTICNKRGLLLCQWHAMCWAYNGVATHGAVCKHSSLIIIYMVYCWLDYSWFTCVYLTDLKPKTLQMTTKWKVTWQYNIGSWISESSGIQSQESGTSPFRLKIKGFNSINTLYIRHVNQPHQKLTDNPYCYHPDKQGKPPNYKHRPLQESQLHLVSTWLLVLLLETYYVLG